MSSIAAARVEFLWLELTGRCQLACVHCYADSSPLGGHGAMTAADWTHVLDEAREYGVETVQFIGGEPTLHPDFGDLLAHALAAGLGVEVFTNLYKITSTLWELFCRPGVRLATSYYSDDSRQHETVTHRPGSHARTRANIAEALDRGIPLRVGVIDMGGGQRVEQARAELTAMGVADIGYDRLRAFGRGAAAAGAPTAGAVGAPTAGAVAVGAGRVGAVDESDTCGQCGHGAAAVGPDGDVWPCVFTRHAVAGNVRRAPLRAILDGDAFHRHVARLDRVRRQPSAQKCEPFCYPCEPCPPCHPSCGPTG
jgi:MoaA/NifB/PqqE/SkfB family radical SAM enzyme